MYEPVNWIFVAFFIFGGKNRYNQASGMTETKSAQQTNSILKNKTTTVCTQRGKSESLKLDKCYNLKVIMYMRVCVYHSTLRFVHNPHVK